MALGSKTGIVAAFKAINKLCGTLKHFRTPIGQVISAAQTSGVINSTQAAVLNTFLDGANAACDIIRLVAGY